MNESDNTEKREILNYLKKIDKIETVVIGIDGSNGLRSKVKEIERFIEEFKPQLVNLTRIYTAVEEIKKNTYRVFWVILTSSVIALGSRFIQITIQDKANREVVALKQETSQTLSTLAEEVSKERKANSAPSKQ
jgi:hypothetical protein